MDKYQHPHDTTAVNDTTAVGIGTVTVKTAITSVTTNPVVAITMTASIAAAIYDQTTSTFSITTATTAIVTTIITTNIITIFAFMVDINSESQIRALLDI